MWGLLARLLFEPLVDPLDHPSDPLYRTFLLGTQLVDLGLTEGGGLACSPAPTSLKPAPTSRRLLRCGPADDRR